MTERASSIDHVLDRAVLAHARWKHEPLFSRVAVLKALASAYLEQSERLALEMAVEMGKPVSQGRQEIITCVSILNYYADNAEQLLADEILEQDESKEVRVVNKPIGAVFGIMPWNYPHYQVIRFAAPNLLLGNTVVLKHAELCRTTAHSIEQLVRSASPYDNLLVNSEFTHDQALHAISDARVAAVSFTGGNRVGAIIGEAAGRAVKKSVLELGGNDPFVIWDESRLEELAQTVARLRLVNAGQTCVSPKRVIVASHLLETFIESCSPHFLSLRPGDPCEEDTDLGPLSSAGAANSVRELLNQALSSGVRVLGAVETLHEETAALSPFIVVNPPRDSALWQQEIFGPVLVVASAQDIAEAIELANDSVFGLGATVYTENEEHLANFEENLEYGMLACNGPKGGSPEYPFGGVKQSGFGRELGVYGLREFANQQLQVRHRRTT